MMNMVNRNLLSLVPAGSSTEPELVAQLHPATRIRLESMVASVRTAVLRGRKGKAEELAAGLIVEAAHHRQFDLSSWALTFLDGIRNGKTEDQLLVLFTV